MAKLTALSVFFLLILGCCFAVLSKWISKEENTEDGKGEVTVMVTVAGTRPSATKSRSDQVKKVKEFRYGRV